MHATRALITATGLVGCTAILAGSAVAYYMDVSSVPEFAVKMRTYMRKSFPSIAAMTPETENMTDDKILADFVAELDAELQNNPKENDMQLFIGNSIKKSIKDFIQS